MRSQKINLPDRRPPVIERRLFRRRMFCWALVAVLAIGGCCSLFFTFRGH